MENTYAEAKNAETRFKLSQLRIRVYKEGRRKCRTQNKIFATLIKNLHPQISFKKDNRHKFHRIEVQRTNKDMQSAHVMKDPEIQAYIVLRSQHGLAKTKQNKT